MFILGMLTAFTFILGFLIGIPKGCKHQWSKWSLKRVYRTSDPWTEDGKFKAEWEVFQRECVKCGETDISKKVVV